MPILLSRTKIIKNSPQFKQYPRQRKLSGIRFYQQKRKDYIMLKLNASYSKKVPADSQYSSQSFHASVEVELPDGLTQDQLNAKIHETFDLVRESVEAELHGNAIPNQPALLPSENNANIQQGNSAPQQNKAAYSKRNGTTSDAPASPKQVKYLLDLARQYGVSPDQIKAKFNVPSVESLTKTQCSRAIDELSGKAA
jgi:hypothetical protein